MASSISAQAHASAAALPDPAAPFPVSIYLPNLQVGGAEHMMVKLANFFVALGHPTSLIVNKRIGELEPKLSSKIRLVNLDADKPWSATWKLAQHLKQARPPLILSALAFTNMSVLVARSVQNIKTKIVISERNTVSQWLLDRGRRRIVDGQLMRAIYPLADGIIAVSKGVANDLSRRIGLESKNIDVIYNPTVDDSTWTSIDQEPPHEWLGNPDRPTIVTAGRLCSQKDFATLIDAFAPLKSEKQARLIILGEGPDRPQLEKMVHRLGLADDVSMPGYVANPLCYFKHASLFALSSIFEGFPNVMVEALAAGAPIVSTDCQSGPREILQEGKYGELVPLRNSAALADAMSRTLEAPGNAAARIKRAKQFSVDEIGRQYLRVLRRVST